MLLKTPFLPRDEPFQTTDGAPIFLFLRKVQRYFPSPIFLFLKVQGTKVPSVFSYSKGGLLPGYGVDEPETGIEGGDWCQTRPMGLTKGGLPPFSRLPGTLVRLPVEIRSKTALILCPLPGVAYKEGTVGTSQRVPAPTRAAGCGHHDHE